MTAKPIDLAAHRDLASAAAGRRHVFVHDLVVECMIGVHPHEHEAPQRVRLNLDLSVDEGVVPIADDLINVVDYEQLVAGVATITARGHVKLVETLAEDIATMCLGDKKTHSVRVRVEKLDVFDNAESVGVEIERFNSKV